MLCCLDLSDRDKTGAVITDGIGDEFGSFGFTLGSQHGSLSLLLSLEYDELGSLSPLLGDLFGFNGVCKILGEL